MGYVILGAFITSKHIESNVCLGAFLFLEEIAGIRPPHLLYEILIFYQSSILSGIFVLDCERGETWEVPCQLLLNGRWHKRFKTRGERSEDFVG